MEFLDILKQYGPLIIAIGTATVLYLRQRSQLTEQQILAAKATAAAAKKLEDYVDKKAQQSADLIVLLQDDNRDLKKRVKSLEDETRTQKDTIHSLELEILRLKTVATP